MNRFDHATTVTDGGGRVLLQILGGGQADDELSDEQLREQIKNNILRELQWDIRISRTH